MTNSGAINAFNFDSAGKGVDIIVTAGEISLDGTIDFESDFVFPTGVFAQTFAEATGDGGVIDIETDRLTINNGAEINTETFSSGNAGNLVIDASELVELTGTNLVQDIPSALQANTRPFDTPITTIIGNGGDIIVNTPRLIVKDGAQINSFNQRQGDGGNITVNSSESILLSGTAPTTQLNIGRTGINVSAAPSEFNSGELIPTTGNAGNLNITTKDLIIEQGAAVAANTFSQGDGGNATIDVDNLTIDSGGRISAGSIVTDEAVDNERGQGGSLNIRATDSVLVIGTGDINGEPVTSNISTIAEGTGDAGNIALTSGNLDIRNGAEINASATGNEAAGDITVDARAVDLDRGNIRAITTAGEGGNIDLSIADNLTLRNESLISAEATGNANGGNIDINANFIIGFSSQPSGSDIIANAEEGTGGNIDVTAESLFGIAQDEAVAGNGTNDIDASSDFGLDGNVVIRVLDVEPIQEMTELPKNLTDGEQTTTQACQNRGEDRPNTLTVKGKGGIIRQPVEPLNSEILTIGQYEEEVEPQESQSPQIKSFSTSQGNITPAQGVAVTKGGQVVLTANRTDRETSRHSDDFSNCIR